MSLEEAKVPELKPGDAVAIRARVVRVEPNGNVVVRTDPVILAGHDEETGGYAQTITLHDASLAEKVTT